MKSPKWVRIALAYATVFLVEKVLNIFKDVRAVIMVNPTVQDIVLVLVLQSAA